MPSRYAYWTILIDGQPTAFRARDKEELQPTFFQLKRKNADVVMKWFARGRLWDTPEQAQWAAKSLDQSREKRGRDWRPGGQHKDPRARFDKRKKSGPSKPEWRGKSKTGAATTRPWSGKPPREGQRPWSKTPRPEGQRSWPKKGLQGERRSERPWQTKRDDDEK